MCGRYVLDRKTTDLIGLFEPDVVTETPLDPSWNVAPTDLIPVIVDSLSKDPDDPEPIRRLEAARWGLVPGWAKDPKAGAPLINARSEDVAEKESFRAAVAKRRAVIPASGYYEWRVADGVKVPHYISLPGDELFLFAGLYEWWKNPAASDGAADRWLLSASILTRPATAELAAIHDRMPVFLDADLVEEWLDPHTEGSQELVDLVADAAAGVAQRVRFHEVGAAVGSVRNNSAELVDAVA
jgi:putative SOS response-associated peptidase YedK